MCGVQDFKNGTRLQEHLISSHDMPAGDIKIISNIHLPRVGTPTPSLSGLQSTSMSVKSSSPNLSVRRSPISTPPSPSSDGNPCLPPINSQLSSESQADVPHIPVQAVQR